MSTQENAALIRTAYERFNQNDLEGVLALFAENVRWTMVPFGLELQGLEMFRGYFLHGLRTAFPDCVLEVTNLVASGDCVLAEYTLRGTHTGPLIGPAGQIPPTGRPVTYQACEVWQFQDGKVVAGRTYFDTGTILRQFGMLP